MNLQWLILSSLTNGDALVTQSPAVQQELGELIIMS